MVVAALVLSAQAAKPGDPPSLTFYQGALVYRKGADVRRLLVSPQTEEPKMSVAYRKNNRYAVWDERGLTVRDGKKVVSTFLDEFATSPKTQERKDLIETVALIKKGVRSKKTSALSGSKRIGNIAYFVPRWTDKEGKTWLEMLVQVDLGKPKPKPQFVSRIDGFSMATKPLDDQLTLQKGDLALVTRSPEEWGLTLYDPATKEKTFKKLGTDLIQYLPGGLFVEKTDYGTMVAGRVDLATGKRPTLSESREELRFIDAEEPAIAVETSASGVTVRNLDSGAVVNVPVGSQVGRMGDLIAVWGPKGKPSRATVYAPERWVAVAKLGGR